MTVKVQVRARGPLVLEGDFKLVDGQGAEVPCGAARRVALCRCGASATKPFCDGSHYRTGFGVEPSESAALPSGEG